MPDCQCARVEQPTCKHCGLMCALCVGSCVYVAVCDRTVGPAVTSEMCLQRVERVECMQQ